MLQPFRKTSLLRLCAAVLFLLAIPATLRAQAVPRYSIDVAGNIGIQALGSYSGSGVSGSPDTSKRLEYGATAGVNLAKHLAVVGEFAYLPQGNQTPVPGTSLSLNYKMYGAAVRYAPFTYKRYVPYLVAGGGYITFNGTATGFGSTANLTQNGDYISYGIGTSIYLYGNWGIRPEFRQDRQSYSQALIAGGNGTARQNANRGIVSVFYQFGGKKAK